MKNFKKILKKTSISKIFYGIILFVLLYIILATDFVYYTAYTVDYLLNRSKYTFKEEGQFSDNTFVNDQSFLTNYMEKIRQSKLNKLPMISPEPISEIRLEDLNPDEINRVSNGFSKPFVVRGLINDFDCVKKWDLDYFEKQYGNIEMLSFSDMKSASYSATKSPDVKVCNKENNLCKLKLVIDDIRNKKPVYVNNISKLFSVSDQAKDELNLDKMGDIINTSFIKERKENDFMSQLFFGGKNTGTNLHCSSNINFFFNIKGKKHWAFIDPSYTDLIKCQTSENGLFAASEDDYFSTSDSNPFFKIPRYETVLEEGDFLFNPSWYWHAVKNKTDYTIAVANRYLSANAMSLQKNEFPTMLNNKFFTFLQLFSPSYYSKFIFYDKEGSSQKVFGNFIDQEIINNVSKSNAM